MVNKIKKLLQDHGMLNLVNTILLALFGLACSALFAIGAFTAGRIVNKLDETNIMAHKQQVIQQRLLSDITFQCEVVDSNTKDIKSLDARVNKNTFDIYKLKAK